MLLKRRSARVAAWTTGGLLGASAIGLLAAPATAATPTVTYEGGCSVLSSTSTPDRGSLSTQKSASGVAKVVVENGLNSPATPYANGEAVKTSDGKALVIDDGDSATIPFESGPVELKLIPRCGLLGLNTDVLKKDHEATKIAVLAPATSGREGSNGGSGSGSGERGSGDGPAADPDAGDRPDTVRDPVARGAVPPGEDGSAPDSADDGSVGAPVADGGDKGNGNGKAAPIVNTNHNRGPGTTTLALIAAVCLLGVGVAALRTILVARAARVSYN